jgi:predicted alpha/beta-hydrolase family hydrolase
MAAIMPRMPKTEARLTFDAGRGVVSAAFDRPARSVATLAIAHGAGAGLDHPFLLGFAEAMKDEGVATLRFNFPYMEAGRRSPDPAPAAVAAWRAAFDVAAERSGKTPVFAGGKSYGGRIASMAVAEGMPAAGLVFLGYPLHPPGRPEKIRDEHLYGISVPMLFVQGTGDAFADPVLLAKVLKKIGSRAELHAIEGGDHSFNVRGARRDGRSVGASLAPTVAVFIRKHV